MVLVHERIERSTLIYQNFDHFKGFGVSVNSIMHKLTFPDITATTQEEINGWQIGVFDGVREG
jgi:hypothetical protein